MAVHYTLSPSAAHRWMTCPASVLMPRQSAPSVYAEEGSRAHEVAEAAVKAFFNGRTREKCDDEDMNAGAAFYVKSVAEQLGDELDQAQILTEQRLPVGNITGEPGAHGTADLLVFTPTRLIVCDYKYGAGVAVKAHKNPQLMIYAAAALDKLGELADVRTVTMMIVQPRVGDGTVSWWMISRDNLLPDSEMMRPIIAGARRGMALLNGEIVTDADYVPGEDTCRWCGGKSVCPKLTSMAVELFEADNVPASPEELSRIYARVPMVRQFCEAVEQEVFGRLMRGDKVPGYKLVAGRAGIRKWSDAAGAGKILENMLGDAAYERKLISPTALEKLAKKDESAQTAWLRAKELVTRPAPKPCIAAEEDERPALDDKVIDYFEET